jgi:hypothetical protein
MTELEEAIPKSAVFVRLDVELEVVVMLEELVLMIVAVLVEVVVLPAGRFTVKRAET